LIGIICAMPEQLDGIIAMAPVHEPLSDGFARIEFGGTAAVVAGRGLGKTQAAMTATTMIERFGCSGLVSAGTAGGLDGIAPLDVLIGTRLIQHDYGRSRGPGQIELYRPGVPPLPEYLNDDIAFELPLRRCERFRLAVSEISYARFGTFASGDTFVNDEATRARLVGLGARAVDMESAAVVQVADFHGVPWLVAKGISDDASVMSHEDFRAGLAEAARRSASVVGALLPHLPD
jgi:adenosylhomocysteine nucleosidase